jgi:hypothetical protein
MARLEMDQGSRDRRMDTQDDLIMDRLEEGMMGSWSLIV